MDQEDQLTFHKNVNRDIAYRKLRVFFKNKKFIQTEVANAAG